LRRGLFVARSGCSQALLDFLCAHSSRHARAVGKDQRWRAGDLVLAAKDKAGAWSDYMLRDKAPAAASCDTAAIQRNLAFGRKHKITGTPTLIFANGSRVPGAISAQEVEKRLAEVAGEAPSAN
jgi:protein-disulfide isomerase